MKAVKGALVLESQAPSSTDIYWGELRSAPVSVERILKFQKELKRDFGYGEVIFNTAITGYQEILTDPSYSGQLVCMTHPHIGNTGVNLSDLESQKVWCGGFILHELCERSSNWRSAIELEDYLKKLEVPILTQVDTRALTRRIRSEGAIRGIFLPESEVDRAQELLKNLPPFEGRDFIKTVTTSQPYAWSKDKKPEEFNHKVVAIDYGIKWNLLRLLENRKCWVEVVPATASAESILERKPDGVFLSNGPGDPVIADYAVRTVQNLLGKLPIFGVCMGHQILGLALGAKIYKLKFGHHGANQPVFNRLTQKVEISSQNHGYAISNKNLPKGVEITHINLNDQTVEGIRSNRFPAFSVQYHPEASPGPHDSMIHFDEFIRMMNTHATKVP